MRGVPVLPQTALEIQSLSGTPKDFLLWCCGKNPGGIMIWSGKLLWWHYSSFKTIFGVAN